MSETLSYPRKYRARTLGQYIGNDKNVKSILNVLRGGRRPQLFLFDGHAGCGKTTMARLLGKEYACENRSEETGACGVCDSCRMIDEFIQTGRSDMLMNLREIDCSVGGNKSSIDEMLSDIELPSLDGGWKTYIFDECHLISSVAQGRLLKVLEEPPPNVLMILCTTDPDKLLDTIRSRCEHRYTVVKPKLQELATLLKRVCHEEGVYVEDRALPVICASADFVPRQALLQLEDVVKEKNDVTYANTVEVLGVVADSYYFRFYEFLLKSERDIFGYIQFLSDIKETMDLGKFLNGLITFTKRGIYIYNGINTEGLDYSEIRKYKNIFSKFTAMDIVYVLNLLMKIKSEDIETTLMLLGYQGILGVEDRRDR